MTSTYMPVPLIFVYKLLPGNDVNYQCAVFFDQLLQHQHLLYHRR